MRPFAAALLLVLVACIVPSRAQTVTNTFVGRAADSNAFVAVVTTAGKAIAYICDGETLAEWFRGPLTTDGRLDAKSTSEQSRITATITGNAVSGKVTLGARTYEFQAAPASGNAGLYRSDDTLDGTRYLGGWAVLSDTEQRGAVVGGGGTRPGLTLEFRAADGKVKPNAKLPGLTLTPFAVTPEFVKANVQ